MKKCIASVVLAAVFALAPLAFPGAHAWQGAPANAAGFEAAEPPAATGEAAVPAGFTPVGDRAALEAIAKDPAGSYVLTADIDLGGATWTPIPFSGVLDGAGHAILNLTVRDFDATTAVSVDGNAKQYDTVYAALFSRATGATIQNLTLLGADVDVTTGQNAFAAMLVGHAEGVTIENCDVNGRVALAAAGTNCGVAGLVGFGYGTATNSKTDATLTFVDTDPGALCEEFLGGALATGYLDVENCYVKVRGYTSVTGYVHNGGIVGMYYVYDENTGHEGYINNNTVDAEIYFYEDNADRRAYCDAYVGEYLNWSMAVEGNTTENFVNGETFDYAQILRPEPDEAPVYAETVTAPDCTHPGHTTYTCETCGYTYNAAYTLPQHIPGEWEAVREATETQTGLKQRHCTVCGELTDEEEIPLVAPMPPNGGAEGKTGANGAGTFPVLPVVLGGVALVLVGAFLMLLVQGYRRKRARRRVQAAKAARLAAAQGAQPARQGREQAPKAPQTAQPTQTSPPARPHTTPPNAAHHAPKSGERTVYTRGQGMGQNSGPHGK